MWSNYDNVITGPILDEATTSDCFFLLVVVWCVSAGRTELEMNVEHEVKLLIEEIKRLGSPNEEGKISVHFGVLFSDEKCANLFEALVGTLRAAKRKKIIQYEGEMLLQGAHDNVPIVLLKDSIE